MPCRLKEFQWGGGGGGGEGGGGGARFIIKKVRIQFICELFKSEGLCYPPCLRTFTLVKIICFG